MATKVLQGTLTTVLATLSGGSLREGNTTSEIAKISGDVVSRRGQTLLRVLGGKVLKGTAGTQIARIDGGRIYRGFLSTQIAAVANGRVTEGTSSHQIAKIDGPYSMTELAALLHLCLAVF